MQPLMRAVRVLPSRIHQRVRFVRWERVRGAVPIDELWALAVEFERQLGGLPNEARFKLVVTPSSRSSGLDAIGRHRAPC
jgi:hypothetical protein